MKLIYTGAFNRREIYTEIRKKSNLSFSLLAIVFLLLVGVPIIFNGIIIPPNSGMSNVVLVQTDSGSGSAIYTGNNQLLTACHVVYNLTIGDRCKITFHAPNNPNKYVYAQAEIFFKGTWEPNVNSADNSVNDFALMRIIGVDPSKITQPNNVGNSSNSKVGDKIAAEGFPNGVYSKTDGTINNISGGMINDQRFFVVSAGAWGGNSGGALLDNNGSLIGVVTQKGVSMGVNDGQTFVVKINHIKSELSKRGFGL